jgi:probable poly-beta-1,6-N-acetyl-D-glucosamine export protein
VAKMNLKRQHIFEIHYIRAIASLMVLLVHVSAAYYYQHDQKFNEYTLFINQVSRFGTPMFAVISGFLLFYQTRNRGFNIKKFASSRFTKIGIPFFLWSCFYLLFNFATDQTNPLKDGLSVFLVNFAFGESFYHLYFMSIVFQFYLIYPLLQLFRSKKSWVILLALAVLINLYFLKLYVPGQYEGIMKVILSQRAFLPSWIFFFIYGGFMAYYWESIVSFSRKYKTILGVAVLILTVLAVFEYKIVGSIPSNRATNLINIPVISLFIIGMGETIKKIKYLNVFLKKIGTLSMAIYLVHPFVLYVFQRIAPDLIWKTSLFPLIFAIILACTIGVVKLIQLLPYNQYILTVPKMKGDKKDNIKTQQSITSFNKPSITES